VSFFQRIREGLSRTAQQIVDRFDELADAGAQHIIASVAAIEDPAQLETIGRDIVPHLRDL
jgi:archaellum component FlaG (FlaF/FlaG flagellin family)